MPTSETHEESIWAGHKCVRTLFPSGNISQASRVAVRRTYFYPPSHTSLVNKPTSLLSTLDQYYQLLWWHTHHSSLDFLLTSSPSAYFVYRSYFPLGFSSHDLISVFFLITPIHPLHPPITVAFDIMFHLAGKTWDALFWCDSCFQVRDPSVCAQRIMEMIVSGMEKHILLTLHFCHTWSSAVKDKREVFWSESHQINSLTYRTLSSVEYC